ncbi:hypothetical protein [Novosphingobium rosa]|uniref:hypothetical protein n=1 Tax=Novosphingobium rosa TaxID=76978 RepID=UPI0008361503|nr:hypothetical protein [Novosphingobium rosa]
MPPYRAPIDDAPFLLNEVLHFDEAMGELGIEVDATLAEAMLAETDRCFRPIASARQSSRGGLRLWRQGATAGVGTGSADRNHGGQGRAFRYAQYRIIHRIRRV